MHSELLGICNIESKAMIVTVATTMVTLVVIMVMMIIAIVVMMVVEVIYGRVSIIIAYVAQVVDDAIDSEHLSWQTAFI